MTRGNGERRGVTEVMLDAKGQGRSVAIVDGEDRVQDPGRRLLSSTICGHATVRKCPDEIVPRKDSSLEEYLTKAAVTSARPFSGSGGMHGPGSLRRGGRRRRFAQVR